MEPEVVFGLSTMILGFAFAAVTPGPNLLAVAATALASGRRPALMIVAGIATAAVIWSLAMFLGVATLLAAYPSAVRALSFAGAAYLSFLAFKGFRSALSSGTLVMASKDVYGSRKAWLRGLTVSVTNPKAALFYASLAVFINGLNVSDEILVGMAIVFGVEAATVYGMMGVLFSTGSFRRVYADHSRVLDFLFACAFLVLALLMVV